MTNKSITALTAATLPVAGTELVPVWDGTATVKATIAQLGPGLAGISPSAVTGTALVSAAIGTTVQAYDADLVTWAGIVPSTGVGTALAVAVGTDGAFVVKGGALGSPSSVGTLPAHTLGGTVAGGGNQINNVIIGTTSPLAGSFTTGVFSSTVVLNTAVSGTQDFVWRSGSLNRFIIEKSGAETGSDAGADLTMYRYTDAGGYLGTVYTITRSNGNIAFSGTVTGNAIKSTNGVSVGGATPAGSGIAFPATAVAVADANTLDDYEEGTWTPGFSFGGGSTGITYSVQGGNYTKVGNIVHCTGYVALSNKGSSTGTASITGLPFIVDNATVGGYATASLRLQNITFTNQHQAYTPVGTTTIGMEQVTVLGVTSSLTDTNFSNSSNAMVCVTYRIQ